MNNAQRCAPGAPSDAPRLKKSKDAGNVPALTRADAVSNKPARREICRPIRRVVLYCTFYGALFVSLLCGNTADLRAQFDRDVDLVAEEATFRFPADESCILLPVDCVGRRRLFLIDTGASVTGFDKSFLHELGRPIRTIEIQFADGSSRRDQLYGMPMANVGGFPLTGISEVFCVDLWRNRAAIGANAYGCIGMDFLRRFVVRLDFDRGEIAFLKAVPEDSGSSVDLHLGAHRRPPTIIVSLPGAGREPFLIDTGLNGTGTINAHSLQKLIEQGNAASVGTSAFASPTKLGVRREVRLRGDVSVGSFSRNGLVFAEGADDNSLGLGYLRRYVVTFDFPGKKLYLKEGSPHGEVGGKAASGAAVWRPNGVTTVRDVEESSAADRAGLKAGDVIEEIDLQLASSLTLRRLRVLVSTVGEHILHVRRGEASVRITLELPAEATKQDGSK